MLQHAFPIDPSPSILGTSLQRVKAHHLFPKNPAKHMADLYMMCEMEENKHDLHLLNQLTAYELMEQQTKGHHIDTPFMLSPGSGPLQMRSKGDRPKVCSYGGFSAFRDHPGCVRNRCHCHGNLLPHFVYIARAGNFEAEYTSLTRAAISILHVRIRRRTG